MIDIKNTKFISSEDRRTCLQRALYTQPYFYKIEIVIPIQDYAAGEFQGFAQAVGIDDDFYLTEIQANFGEAHEDIHSFFNINIYTGYNKSLYRYDASHKLPSGFITTEARFRTVVTNEVFDDRQRENSPFLIRKNDKIYFEASNAQALAQGDLPYTLTVVLKGFRLLEDVFIDNRQVDQLNASLARPTEWQLFAINMDVDGKKSYILENDNQPRLILGFSAINAVTDKTQVSSIDTTIIEVARRLRLTDNQIPLQFIAPRLTCLLDAHIYYLPVEYYFQPYSKLQFDATIVNPDLNNPTGAEVSILTRTI